MKKSISIKFEHFQNNDPMFMRGNISTAISRQAGEVFTDAIASKELAFNSAAGIVFTQKLDELLMNSLDARATELNITFIIENNTIIISLTDNGTKTIPSQKLGKYDWVAALKTNSEKKGIADQLGGKHLGLAICAYFLEVETESGNLHLMQNFDPDNNTPAGATIELRSNTKSWGDIDILPEGVNYNRMMIEHAHKTSLLSNDEYEALLKNHPLKGSDRDTRSVQLSSIPASPCGLSASPCGLSASSRELASSLTSPASTPSQNPSFTSTSEIGQSTQTTGTKRKKPISLFRSIIPAESNGNTSKTTVTPNP